VYSSLEEASRTYINNFIKLVRILDIPIKEVADIPYPLFRRLVDTEIEEQKKIQEKSKKIKDNNNKEKLNKRQKSKEET